MKKTEKLVPQVLLRRMILVLLDAAIVIFSFYFALLLRADGAVEASWWPHNRALLYQNLLDRGALPAQLSGGRAVPCALEVCRGA